MRMLFAFVAGWTFSTMFRLAIDFWLGFRDRVVELAIERALTGRKTAAEKAKERWKV